MKKYFLILSLIITQILTAQSYVSTSDSISIDQQLDSHFGVDYQIEDIIFVDSLEEHFDRNREVIDDEYGTLDDCIVFMASIKDLIRNVKGVVGVYKNGQIIWYSDYITPDDEIYGGIIIKAIMDNNNDGKVEIMTEWEGTGGASYSTIRLFIHEWDGTRGVLVGDAYCHENKMFDFIDVQGDGVFEIFSYTDAIDNTPTIYEWNGVEYVLSSIKLESKEMFFPRNNFTPIVTCVVTKSNSTYIYEYTIKNSESSAQSINEFDVYGFDKYTKIYGSIEVEDTTVTTIYNKWQGNRLRSSVTWYGYPIKPGNQIDGFLYKTNALPVIGYAYLRGYNYQWSGDYRENTSVKDYLNNSVIVKTIAAKFPPEPFVPVEFIDTLKIYTDSSYALGWITNQQTRDKYDNYFNTAKTYLEQNNNNTAKSELQKVLTDCNTDSSSVLTSEAYALLYFNTDYLIKQIPEGEPVLPVKLEDSQGNLLQGGSLQYYDSGWKDATDNGDGTFTVQTEKSTVSLKMNYAGASQQLNNVAVGPDTAVFQTVNATVKLLNSQGTQIDTGAVKYYASGWKDLGTTVNGEAAKELLPKEYSFRMSYGGASLDKKQNISDGAAVVFQTVNAKVQLKDSQGNLLDGGTVKYYASGWKDFGEATNGEVTKELLPKEYSFRMNYGGASLDKKQNISDGAAVVFQTVNAKVQLKDSQGNLLDGGTVKYYASGWKDFGTAANGEAAKELLPKEYSFRMNYGGASLDKKHNISDGAAVVFQTVNAKVQLKDSQGNLLDGGTVKYYASGWKDFGTAANGEAAKELLPKEYSFRMSYGGASLDKKQNISDGAAVVFQTVNAKVQLKDSQGNLLDGGTVKYYASGWKDFGTAANGEAAKELLPKEYSFRMSYGGASLDKKQNISDGAAVVFQTVNAKVQLKDSQGNLLDGGTVKYYASGWKDFGTAANGEAAKELLPKEYSFRMSYGGASQDKKQNISDGAAVVFQTVNAKVQLKDSQGNLLDGGTVKYYASGWKDFGTATNGEAAKELLPKEYSFRMSYANISNDKSQDISTNSTVIFTTVQTTVKVKDANNQPVDGAEVQYYGNGWQSIGTTVNGEVTKELLPKEITFKAIYNSKQSQKQQDISGNSIVEITIE